MHPDVRKAYDKFVITNWGIRKDENGNPVKDEVAEAVIEYDKEEKKQAILATRDKKGESLGDLELDNSEETIETVEKIDSKKSKSAGLDIVDTGHTVSEEDLEDAAIFFDFFDEGGVDI